LLVVLVGVAMFQRSASLGDGRTPEGRLPILRGSLVLLLLTVSLGGCGKPGDKGGAWVDPCDGVSATPAAGEPDHSLWTQILSKHVRPGELEGIRTNVVNYSGVREDLPVLRSYLAQLCHLDPNLSPRQALAAALNGYNAMMTAMIVHYNPVKSVHEIPTDSDHNISYVWTYKWGTFNGSKVSLNDIEQGLVRDYGKGGGLAVAAGEVALVHAAMNCGSISCPDLGQEAFLAPKLSEQLHSATRNWLANPTKNPGPGSNGTVLTLSSIFMWYGVDFVTAEGSVQEYVNKYSAWNVSKSAAIKFLPYDWNLINASAEPTLSADLHSEYQTVFS
jgi:hypothetical protein